MQLYIQNSSLNYSVECAILDLTAVLGVLWSRIADEGGQKDVEYEGFL